MSGNAVTGLVKQTAKGPSVLLVALAIVCLFTMTLEGRIPPAWADIPSVPEHGNLPEGEITAIGSMAIDVAGRFYGLHPKLTIVSDEGKPIELKELKPGLIIRYHVKEGALDQIIVLMPR